MARRGVVPVLILSAFAAQAGPKVIAIGAGDCRGSELIEGATEFSKAVTSHRKGDAVDGAALLERLRPLPTAGLDDVQRQLDGAQSQFYSGQLDQALEVTRNAIRSLERLSPSEAVAKQLIASRILEGLIFKAQNKKTEQLDAWRRVLRVAPDFKLDPDFQTPASIAQFDGLKKDLQKLKKVPLTVTSTPPGASVFVDGVLAGKTPLKNAAFIPGTYRVVLAQGDTQSFVYEVKLDAKPVELAVDLAFEGTLRPALPLCVSGTDADALKLATRAGADEALVLRVESRNAEPGWVSAVVYDVAKGARVREGGMKVAAARKPNGYSDLARFVLTGEPAALALPGSSTGAPPPAVVAKAPPPVVVEAPAPGEPPPAEVAQSSASSGLPRIVPIAIAGVGVVLAVTGVALFVSGGGDRASLQSVLDSNGQVRDPIDAENAVLLDQRIQSNKTTSLVLGLTGVAVAATGAVLFFALAPKDAPQVGVLLTPGGAWAGVTGSF